MICSTQKASQIVAQRIKWKSQSISPNRKKTSLSPNRKHIFFDESKKKQRFSTQQKKTLFRRKNSINFNNKKDAIFDHLVKFFLLLSYFAHHWREAGSLTASSNLGVNTGKKIIEEIKLIFFFFAVTLAALATRWRESPSMASCFEKIGFKKSIFGTLKVFSGDLKRKNLFFKCLKICSMHKNLNRVAFFKSFMFLSYFAHHWREAGSLTTSSNVVSTLAEKYFSKN